MSDADSLRLFVLDTNVLMHDPTALFRFQEHDLFLPMVVLEELDAGKKGVSEVARNVRQVSRFLDDLIGNADKERIDEGLPLPGPCNGNGNGHDDQPLPPAGRLYLQTHNLANELPAYLPGKNVDNSILATTLSLQETRQDRLVTLVSKDINLRIKARVLGIQAEDYYNDKVLDDADLLYTGVARIDGDFWAEHGRNLESWQQGERTYYRFKTPLVERPHSQQCLYTEGEEQFEAIVKDHDTDGTTVQLATDYRKGHNSVWGINARNTEQNFALNLLLDPEVDIVSLLGAAGTGKTLLALAAGLQQTLDTRRYREIIITRVTIPVGEDIGFLPGTEEEKMAPWMGALMDNLEVLTQSEVGGEWGRAATDDLIQKRIKLRSLNFMRGRTFLNRYIILDEAQNLTSKQMKTLITRAGPGSKIVCLGNISQIDTPYLSETTSGLTFVVERFRDWLHSGHITLARGERSRLADFASEML
ncbi:PhoH-like ATPase [Methylohalomonas lacus]|uniref:PhoH-like ATPase n=1 Tax=Methylohalomonas lacus TaxID=398773 RepID=A0AAE3HJ51_9GAMM|nr:PhoH family protein [Methylohalomonas lacus]MCS3902118.1 PhoH-like ATPase [Methylohalomonas lacus]